jgi:hypothetical protein
MIKNTIKSFEVIAAEWRGNAERLATFVEYNLVNRDDFYIRYRPLEQRHLGKAEAIKERFGLAELLMHFQASNPDHVIGLPTTSQEQSCRWIVIDVDSDEEDSEESQAIREKVALEFASRLGQYGSTPLVIKSSENSRFHVWMIFDHPISSKVAFSLGRKIVEDWRSLGLQKSPEVFPKQEQVAEGKLPNSVRLPGLHHTQKFYSEVWGGEKWLTGSDAVLSICAIVPFASRMITDKCAELSLEIKPNHVVTNAAKQHGQHVANLLSKLKLVSENCDGWSARCPGHNDNTPSLSVSIGEDKKILVHCFAGCDTKKILEAVGLEMRDLYPPPPSSRSAVLPPRTRIHRQPVVIAADPEFVALQKRFAKSISPERIEELAHALGVTAASLRELQIGWSHDDSCWTFPEYNVAQQVCGILRRFKDGQKRTIKGSRRGLTLPLGWGKPGKTLHILEGQSDVAAAISDGRRAIGRPGTSGGVDDLIQLLESVKDDLVIVADNDKSGAGLNSAKALSDKITTCLHRVVKVICPPESFKDFRSCFNANTRIST